MDLLPIPNSEPTFCDWPNIDAPGVKGKFVPSTGRTEPKLPSVSERKKRGLCLRCGLRPAKVVTAPDGSTKTRQRCLTCTADDGAYERERQRLKAAQESQPQPGRDTTLVNMGRRKMPVCCLPDCRRRVDKPEDEFCRVCEPAFKPFDYPKDESATA